MTDIKAIVKVKMFEDCKGNTHYITDDALADEKWQYEGEEDTSLYDLIWETVIDVGDSEAMDYIFFDGMPFREFVTSVGLDSLMEESPFGSW